MSQLTEQQLPKVPPSVPPIPTVPAPNYSKAAPHPPGASNELTNQVVTQRIVIPSGHPAVVWYHLPLLSASRESL